MALNICFKADQVCGISFTFCVCECVWEGINSGGDYDGDGDHTINTEFMSKNRI